jgi:peptidoglycan-associated lipoprotein
MRINIKALSTAVLAVMLLMTAAGCKKKVAPAPPPPPAPAPAPAPPPPPPPAPKPQAARIDTFAAEPATIDRGQSATLRWAIANATDMSIDQGIGAVQATGNRSVSPNNTTTYTLTARGAGGMDSRSVTVNVNTPPPPPPKPKPAPAPPKVTGADMLTSDAKDAYFDYDMSDLRDDARQATMADADLLRRIFAADPTFNVVIEGHCDERGSAEYNLGLGDRRATAMKDMLVQLGLPANRIGTLTLGKERPVCTEANEACYQKNRRAHLVPAK